MIERNGYRDFPLVEIAKAAEELIAHGATVFQKFSCEHCGERQTIHEPNKLYTAATCEACGGLTDIADRGCNYALAMKVRL